MKVKYNPPQEKRIESRAFDLLMAIKREITRPEPSEISALNNNELIELIVDVIIEAGDRLDIQIRRERNKFFIYTSLERIPLDNHDLEEFLGWVGKHISVSESIVYNISFRNQVFARCWRLMESDE